MSKGKVYTLITGGSQGIGRAMADECASRGHNIIIVALQHPDVDTAKAEIEAKYGVDVKVFCIDLSQREAPQMVHDWFTAEGLSINILINNAGYGRSGLYLRHELETYYNMLELNNRAVVGLVYKFLPEIRKHPKGYILIMGSAESTMPMPYKAIYTGTKHFLFGFSLALKKELEEDNIGVTIVTPGPTVTNEDGRKRIKDAGLGGKIVLSMPEGVAKKAINGMFRGRLVVPAGNLIGQLMWLSRHLPHWLKMKLLMATAKDFKNH